MSRNLSQGVIRKLTPAEIGGAAWLRLAIAAEKTGASVYALRHSGLHLRRIGNADYLDPVDLNLWVEGPSRAPSSQPEQQPEKDNPL
jgi:hypothetical protein